MNDAERDELLIRVDEHVKAIDDRLKVGDVRLSDHAGRIRLLEIWRGGLAGGLTLLGALIGWKVL
jgi:hypothetical protein